MPAITALLQALIANFFISRQPAAVRRSKMEWAFLGLFSLCASIGIFFLVLAMYQYIELFYAPYIAALISAGILFVPALIAILIKAILARKEEQVQPQSIHDQLSEQIHNLIKELGAELEDPIKDNPKMAILLAALAGLIVARKI